MRRNFHFIWFLMGLGSALQIVASLSITEAVVLLIAPFLVFSDYKSMSRHGIAPFFLISLCVVVGGFIACECNVTPSYYYIRGMAVAVLLPCAIVVSHFLLTKDMNGYKWFFVGLAISMILNTFILQRSVEVSMLAEGVRGEGAVESIMSGPIYWISRLRPMVMLPIEGWYLQTPAAYSFIAPFAFAVFAMVTSASGRSSALTAILGAAFVLLGGTTRQHMKRLMQHGLLLLLLGVIAIFLLNAIYRHVALSGMIGEKAREKYVVQSGGSSSVFQLLLRGRAESIAGYFACIDKPIIGFGPYLVDEKGYIEEFLAKFCDVEDYNQYKRNRAWELKQGILRHRISAHSSVVVFWLQFGIAGLMFWLYSFYVLFRFFKKDMATIPQWFGWLVCGMPALLWDAFFSPFSNRITVPMYIVACLMARAVRLGRFRLPQEMELEIIKKEQGR